MAFRSFRFQVVIRITLILILGYLSIYIFFYTHFWLVAFWTTLLAAILIYSLVRYVERSNRELANFLLAIKQGDFTNTYHRKGSEPSKDELNTAFSEILSVFQYLSTEKETNHLFLQTVVEHVSIALITFDKTGEVISVNKAAKNLINRPYLKHLSSLEKIEPQLYEALKHVQPDHREVVKMVSNGQLQNLSIRATDFILKNEEYKIVSIQDIKGELDEKEVESWQKLIRVLTHEIMNSAIPISTLSSVISEMMEDEKGNPLPISQLDDDVGEDVLGGLKTIESRSKGLVRFVEAYKSLTKIDPPKFKEVDLNTLVDGVLKLLDADLKKGNVKIEKDIRNLIIKADPELIEQVLINLIKNASEALENTKSPLVSIKAKSLPNGRTMLEISDNGPGIEAENLDNIFVPFFSTKKKGSGIGLSLSRQIMRLHKGSISVNSEPGEGTSFSLVF
ncbi:MAG: ATP-binding protein [Cyclobacteriaceae bacterium]